MKQRSILLLGLTALLIRFLADSEGVAQSASAALKLCGNSVIPALFPCFVVSAMLISSGLGQALSPLLTPLMTGLFRLPGCAGAALALGLMGGYPIGGRTAAELFRCGALTKEETCRLLTFCNNANPAFFLGVLGGGVFHSTRTGLTLWLIHVLSALLSGLLLARRSLRPACRRSPPPLPPKPFAKAWTEAVGSGLQAILSVCAFVVMFRVLTAPLTALPGEWGMLATGVTELFSLIPLLPADGRGFLLAAFCSGWGGLSVLCQTAAMLEGTDLPLAPVITGKAVQALLSALLAGLLVAAKAV